MDIEMDMQEETGGIEKGGESATPPCDPSRLVPPAQKTLRRTPHKSPHKSPQKAPPQMSPAKSPQKGKEPRTLKEPGGMIDDPSDDNAVDDDNVDDEDEFFGEASSVASGHSEESGSENDWGGDGDDDDEKETNHLCIHCQYDEDNDPASDFEEPLGCVVCKAFSHRNCDRNANEAGGVKSAFDDRSSTWRCPTCAANGLELGSRRPPPESRVARRKSPPKVKDSRSLRKRKANDMDEDDAPIARRRKRRDKPNQANGVAVDVEEHDEGGPNDITLTNGARKRRRLVGPKVSSIREPNRFIVQIEGLDPVRLGRVCKTPSTAVTTVKRRSARSSTPMAKLIASALPAGLTASATLYPIIPEDDKSKPYGGILTEEESLTTETLPGTSERTRFDIARKKAEDEQKMRTELMDSMNQFTYGRRERDQEAKRLGEASLIECIHFGEYEIDTWYAAPYPAEYSMNKVLWICEFCLKYMNSEYVCWRHKMKCPAKHPPGDEIYRDGSVSVFEIDGRKHPVYCQNLCLMAKLFLGSKTLYYDVHPFLFYVMTERDEYGMHLVGYFSKEKREGSPNNVSCIITLPIHQRKGYGNLLIDFSYLLSRVEKRTGSPEKPFSDLGLVSYRNYWKLRLCYELRHQKDPLTIADLSRRTGMTTDDIICGLEALNALVRDPVTGYYALRLDHALFEALIERWEVKGYIKLNPEALIWSPYIMGRSQAEHLDGMPLSTIAPRAGERSKDDADDGNHPLEDPDSMNSEPALVGLGAANGAPAATNGESAHRSSPSPGSSLQMQQPSPRKKLPPFPQPLVPSAIIAKIREIPPTRFEVVPLPLGARGRPGVLKGAGRGRGRPRLDSPVVRGLGKGGYGATPAMERRGRGRPRLNERLVPESSPAPAITGTNKRIVAKAPRMRSLTADVTRARSTSTEGSLRRQEKGNSISAASVAAVATSTVSASPASSISSSSSSSSSSSDEN